jgi:hypothetical protein
MSAFKLQASSLRIKPWQATDLHTVKGIVLGKGKWDIASDLATLRLCPVFSGGSSSGEPPFFSSPAKALA